MLDSRASHNIMPKEIMEKLGLDITREYKDLYSFYSWRVKCLGMIKDSVVVLAQVPVKSIVMDVQVVDVPPNYGMLLSRSWEAKLGDSLQLDLSYATIPIFEGGTHQFYRESCWKIKDIILGFDSPILIITCECVSFFYLFIILSFIKQLYIHEER